MLGPNFVKMLLYYQILNKILPVQIILQSALNKEGMLANALMKTKVLGQIASNAQSKIQIMLENSLLSKLLMHLGYKKTYMGLTKKEHKLRAASLFIFGAEKKAVDALTKSYMKKAAAMAKAMLPYVAVAAAISLLIGAFYVVNKETGVFSDLMYSVGQEMGALKGIFLEVF